MLKLKTDRYLNAVINENKKNILREWKRFQAQKKYKPSLKEKRNIKKHPIAVKDSLKKTITSKNHFRNRDQYFIKPNPEKNLIWFSKTSGTTGSPVTLYFSTETYLEKGFLTLPKIIHTYFQEKEIFSALFISDDKNLTNTQIKGFKEIGMERLYIYSVKKEEDWESLLSFIQKKRPKVISSKPSLFGLLVQKMSEQSLHNDSARVLISSGSQLLVEVKNELEKYFCAPIVNAYNTTEAGYIASECRFKKLHVDETALIPEILQNNNKISKLGKGMLLISSFKDKYSPLIRYQVGDRVELIRQHCECGKRGIVIKELIGRTAVVFKVLDKKIPQSAWMRFFDKFPECTDFQIIQKSKNSFLMNVKMNSKMFNSEMKKKLKKDFNERISKSSKISIRQSDGHFANNNRFIALK